MTSTHLAVTRAAALIALGLFAGACTPAAPGSAVATPTTPAVSASVVPSAVPPTAVPPSTPTKPSGNPLPPLGAFSQTTLTVRGAGGSELPVYVADSPAERQRGLMGVEDLPDGSGMLFVFDEPSTGGFWMKDTLIPLSIAFLDERGRALAVLDMMPCEADPCEVYTPGVTYTNALEVEQGLFAELGFQEGDRLSLPPELLGP
ncbi:MAG: DUF192 domain-containing protein [Egibacteraceae bacterium]